MTDEIVEGLELGTSTGSAPRTHGGEIADRDNWIGAVSEQFCGIERKAQMSHIGTFGWSGARTESGIIRKYFRDEMPRHTHTIVEHWEIY
jgi:hypothetical protein